MLTSVPVLELILASPAVQGSDLAGRMMVLAIQLGIILFTARIFGVLAEKAGIPGVLGELVSGIIIGPFLLGGIPFYGFPQGLFPVYHAAGSGGVIWPELMGISSIAAVVLLFNVGLETDLKLLLKYSFSGGMVGLGGVLFSFFLGDYALVLFSRTLSSTPLGFMSPECLFAGTVATATSVGITARILSEKKKMDTAEGVTILSAAVIDDVIGIVVLAVVMGMVAAGRTGATDWSHIGIVSAKAVGVWLAGTVLGITASRRIGKLLKLSKSPESITVLALGLALVLAGLFEEAGLAMIIGAYVMGLSLSRTDVVHMVREKLHIIYAFLVPVFFSVTGMQIDPSSFLSRTVLVFGTAYTLVAALAKVAGCGLPALMSGFNLRGALRIGFGMMPRGEVGLIVAGIGLSAGFLDQGLFASVILMVVVNTIVAPPVLVKLFRNPLSGLRRGSDAGSAMETQIAFDFPSGIMATFFVEKLCSVFKGEGFFVHRLGHEDDIYQVRKDSYVINFTRKGNELRFDCGAEDLPMVRTAIEEALAGVEAALGELRKPLDTHSLRSGTGNGPAGGREFSIRDYMRPDQVRARLKATTRDEAIEELLDILVRTGAVSDRQAALQAVMERERSMSTGMENGLAIPHGKTNSVRQLVCAAGISRKGIEFQSMDGRPARLIVLTISPVNRPAPHLEFMAAISRTVRGEGMAKLLSCSTGRELYEALT